MDSRWTRGGASSAMGRRVHLTRMAFDLLTILIEHMNRTGCSIRYRYMAAS
jgi:hypothetical protein